MISKNFKRFIVILILISLVFAIACKDGIRAKKDVKVKNVIVLIGDGMGNQQRRIAAIVEGKGDADHRLVCESLTTSGVAFDHSLDAIVTDSAAAGTALATGYKTNNGMISMTPDGKSRTTILEACKQRGKSTGLITDVTIAHATPAVYGAHVKQRKMYSEIASQYLKNGIDFLMAGGTCDFLPKELKGKRKDKRHLINEFKKSGYTYISDLKSFNKLNPDKDKKVLGLFRYGSMDYEIDRNKAKEPSLAEMTNIAIKTLKKNPKGFFLMVEGGKIDWANHGHDVAGSVYNTIAFDKAVKVALDFAKNDKHTLIIVVNDHETGGMTITAGTNISQIRKLKATSGKMAGMIKKDGSNVDEVFGKYAGIDNLTDKERKMVIDEANGKLKVRDELGYGGTIIAHIISKRTGVLFATGGHSGTPVIVAAYGPGCQIFDGFYDQTDIPKKIGKLLGIKFPF
ncbi:MAG: alkaline phosphatase [Candidatus Eremiobacteraeota bacterium]|nr:alkaline phosphatase [Candidatus Eremiobacteraeota bacterium]